MSDFKDGWNAAISAVREEIQAIPHWSDPGTEYGEFDLQPLDVLGSPARWVVSARVDPRPIASLTTARYFLS